MRYLIAIILFVSCNSPSKTKVETSKNIKEDSIVIDEKLQTDYLYNEAFRNISLDSLSDETISVSGEARVFEGTLYYYLRQGKEESDDEFVTASAGAPEWGKFNFTINPVIYKKDEHLYLYLFESSAKDGSRIHELKIKIW